MSLLLVISSSHNVIGILAFLKVLSMFPAAIGCEIPEVQNGKVHGLQSTYKAGETLHFDCDAGYASEDTYEAQCQPGGSWDPPVLVCERGECRCPLFPRGQEQCVQAEPFLRWALTHQSTITAAPSPRTLLSLRPCPMPPEITNGHHNPSDSHLPGSAVQYSCRDGYSLIGNASISCTAEGTWSRPRPRCEANGCKRPAIENGRTTGLETTYRLGDLVVFECDFGYALKGSQESHCQFGGTWDPPVPVCEKSKCK
uniref:Sushi domain-containing protein n=1 Tax=Strix occidentalis caurina TaxID=311401 RepID=A0A8D0F2J4_STROC